MRRGIGFGYRVAVAVILLVGAALVVTMRSRAPAGAPVGTVTVPTLGPARYSAHDGAYDLVQLPDDGMGAIYRLVAQARRSVALEVYELSDPVLMAELVWLRDRGVEVRVLLSRGYHSGSFNRAAYSYLRGHSVPVRWAPASRIFHIKAMVVDDAVAVVSTGNFVSTPVGAGTRDAAVVDRDRAQVAAVAATVGADWSARTAPTTARSAPGLVWSPGAQRAMSGQISGAQHSVLFTSEELADADVYGALAADARRGVACYVVMTYDRAWRVAWRTLVATGCQVHVGADRPDRIYLHIKRVLVDAGRPTGSLLLGSQNASATSLGLNRELSLRLTQAQAPGIIAASTATFWRDYAAAPAWSPG